jgi:hypothetical protein
MVRIKGTRKQLVKMAGNQEMARQPRKCPRRAPYHWSKSLAHRDPGAYYSYVFPTLKTRGDVRRYTVA